jgi:hypothetical protein
VGLSMAERHAVTKQMAKRYARSTKKQRGRSLDELCALTGWSRRRAIRALAQAIDPKPRPPRAPRARVYGPEILEPLRFVWATLNGPAGKRLAPFMTEIVAALERSGELKVDAEVRSKLCSISAATIDRLLLPERARLRVKGRSGTKPGSILKRQIPIRTFAEWDEARPGFCEIDLVAHDGGLAVGDFCQTLDLTCVATGWTECRAVRNKAQRWCFEALMDVRSSLPFALLGLDSDNGSEFINDQLYRYCSEQGITFTRSRPYRKNDNCFVEQKNWPVVRQNVGYARYDTAAELAALNELYARLRLYVNFFQPQMKLVSKTRHGAKVAKHFDEAKTPYRRVLASPLVGERAKEALTETYLALNPAKLKREIAACQDRLVRINRAKPDQTKEVRRPGHPSVGGKFSWPEISRTSLVRQPGDVSRTS